MSRELLYTFAEKHRVPYNELCTALREALAAPQPEPVAWKHDCAALCTNDVELWIDACPHCGKPRTAPSAAPADLMLAASAASATWKSYWQGGRAHAAAVDFAQAMTALDEAIAAAPAPAVPDQAVRTAANALLHQIDIGDFVDSNGHSAKMLKAVHDLMRALSAAPAVPAEDFCLCNDDISLQFASGGGSTDGLYGRLFVVVDGKTVEYVRAESAAPAVREPQEHVGWCRYVTAHEKATRLVLCDSDAPGAFRVYRGIGGGGNG